MNDFDKIVLVIGIVLGLLYRLVCIFVPMITHFIVFLHALEQAML